MIVPKAPTNNPEFLNAIGIARIPVPNELFSKCANAPIVLRKIIYQFLDQNDQLFLQCLNVKRIN